MNVKEQSNVPFRQKFMFVYDSSESLPLKKEDIPYLSMGITNYFYFPWNVVGSNSMIDDIRK